jgi:hypothetical protein
MRRFSAQVLAAMIAIRESRTEVASGDLRDLAAIVREYAIPLVELSCLLGFAALAEITGDQRPRPAIWPRSKQRRRSPFALPRR